MKKILKTVRPTLAALTLATMMAVSPAGAVPILVSEWFGPSGLGNPQNDPNSNEDASVAAQIVAYNAVNNPDLPLLAGLTKTVSQQTTSMTDFGNDSNVLNWTAPMDCDFYYIMTKWGQGQATWDHALHYVLAGETVIYNPGGAGFPMGLSHVSIWCGETERVPDGGSTLAFLSLAMVLVAPFIRRKLS